MTRRVLTALVLIPPVLLLVWLAPTWLFLLLGALPVGLLALWEYLELAGRWGTMPARWALYGAALALWLAAAFWSGQLVWVLAGGGLFLILVAAFQQRLRTEALSASAASLLGLLYIAAPFALLIDLRGEFHGRLALIYLLVLVWVGDTAAYFVGRVLGRHKLVPALSPGKTVEGTAASLVATVAVGFWLFRVWFDPAGEAHAFMLPLITNVVAQFGDLAESALKRRAGVKDSSGLIPGHGGMLDRVDSLLFAGPALWYYWSLLTPGSF